MRYSSSAAFCVGMFLCSASFAATVDSLEGQILLNRGDGFQVLTAPTTANPGDKVMASADGNAKLRYADGCVIDIRPGAVVSVGEKSPCTAPYLGGFEEVPQEHRFYVAPFLIGAGAVVGIACASGANFCEEEHRRRRRVTQGASD